MVELCSSAKVWRRDWKTESWVWSEEVCVERRVAPWFAYDWLACVRFAKAPRPTPRREAMIVLLSED
jgi:hypothetical protein